MVKESQIVGMSRSHNVRDKDNVINFLIKSFSNLRDRKNGWIILLRLTHDSNRFIKISAIQAIGICFVDIPDKEDAWERLFVLAKNLDKEVKDTALYAMSTSFSYLPSKEGAWKNVLELIKSSTSVNDCTALVFLLPECFNCFDEKEKIIDDLKRLAIDENPAIKSFGNNLIGKVYILKSVKASGAEFNKIYSEAIIYFKKSSDVLNIPSHKFCYVMHNIFNKIIEGEVKDANEINKGIEELKTISEESTEKKKIVKILDELHIILEETLDAQKKGEDISKFKEKIIPICTELNTLIGTLNNEIIRQIAEKAKERINFEYRCTIKALKIVDNLIESPNKLISEPNLLLETIKLCCISISEPICDSYKSKLEEIEKEVDAEKKQVQLLQFIKEIKPVLENQKTIKEIIVLGQNEIKEEINKFTQKLDGYFISINKNGPRQEIVVSTGIEMFGTGSQVVTTIPINEIGYDELNEDIVKIKNNMLLSEIPKRLKDRILECVATISKK